MAQWYPLMPAVGIRNDERIEALIAHAKRIHPEDFDEAKVRAAIDEELSWPVFKNWLYQVSVRKTPTDFEREDGSGVVVNLVHLSIKRIDKKPVHDWRDLQRIKNQLLGEECEAMELYPAESRLVDTANQYHLWGYDDPGLRAPFGFPGPRVVDDTAGTDTGTRQRKLAK
jgi:hypothetical protein